VSDVGRPHDEVSGRYGEAAGQARAAAIDAVVHHTLVAGIAVGLALRSVFESVMVAFYLWPGLAVALIAATRNWRRLIPTSVVAVAVTFGSQSSWRSPWGWWGFMVAGLALTLFFAGAPREEPRPPNRRHGLGRHRSHDAVWYEAADSLTTAVKTTIRRLQTKLGDPQGAPARFAMRPSAAD